MRLTQRASRLLEQSTDCTITDESIEVQGDGVYGGIVLAGKVAAGIPIDVIENREKLSLNKMFGEGSGLFALEVAGESMTGEGIYDGDYVICERSQLADDGELVVAIVDQENATLKRFYKEPKRARLESANKAYEPIYSDNCRIEGRVIGLVRRI